MVHDLARELSAIGHDVVVATNRYPRTLARSETLDSVRVERRLFLSPRISHITSGRMDLLLASLFVAPSTLAGLARLLRRFRPDVVNVHFPASQVPFVLALRRFFSFRLVVSLHGADVEEHDGTADSLVSALRTADAVTACSRNLLGMAVRIEPSVADKGVAVYNGRDFSGFEDKTAYDHPRPYILAFGRLTQKKGFDMLLRAFQVAHSAAPGIDLVQAGEGEERERLGLLAAELGLSSCVKFVGRASPGGIARLLNGCLFVVIPSRHEPFGLAALESMAAGKCILATRVGGMPEFVDQDVNRLVEPSVAGLTEGLRDFFMQLGRVKEMGQHNVASARRYTLKRMVEGYVKVYSGARESVAAD